jgi:G:T-mismatch repair DNA endonuclease (very short patch repair protein)
MCKITTVDRASRAARLQVLAEGASRAFNRIRIAVTDDKMARVERMHITGQLSKIFTDFTTTIYHHGGFFPSFTFAPSLFSHPATRIFWNLPLKD